MVPPRCSGDRVVSPAALRDLPVRLLGSRFRARHGDGRRIGSPAGSDASGPYSAPGQQRRRRTAATLHRRSVTEQDRCLRNVYEEGLMASVTPAPLDVFLDEYSRDDVIAKYLSNTAGTGIAHALSHVYAPVYLDIVKALVHKRPAQHPFRIL